MASGVFLLLWSLGFLLLWRVPAAGAPPPSASRLEPDPSQPTPPGSGATLSVIIPARDEAGNLPALLESLRGQGYPVAEVIVVDDHSTDNTAKVAKAAGARVLNAADLPADWCGKSWACWQGAALAEGEFLLFLDADVRLEPGGLQRLVDTFRTRGGLLSVQPYHRTEAAYENLAAFFNLVTMAGFGVFGALPRRSEPAAAFGPCNLCRRQDYFAVDGHRAARHDVVESLPLARAFAGAGLPVTCLGGRGSVSFRMYPDGIGSLTEGFAKSFALGAGAIPAYRFALIGGWLTAGFEAVRHLLIAADGAGLLLWGAAYLLYAGQTQVLLARIGRFSAFAALAYPVPLLFFLGVFLWSLLTTHVFKRVAWKGRRIATP